MFARANRLRRSHEIMTVFRRGSRRSCGPLTCYLFPTSSEPQVTVIVDKKVSKLATERNLVKRRIRAELRIQGLPAGQLVVRAHNGAVLAPYKALQANLESCLRALSR